MYGVVLACGQFQAIKALKTYGEYDLAIEGHSSWSYDYQLKAMKG